MKKKINDYLKEHYRLNYVLLTILILVIIYAIFFNRSSNVYLKGSVSQSDVISSLMNELNIMDSRLSNEVGWVMTIVSLVMGAVGFYSYNQWKMSQNQIKKLEDDFEDEFKIKSTNEKLTKYKSQIDKYLQDVNSLKDSLKETEDSYKKDLEESKKSVKNLTEKVQVQKEDNFQLALESASSGFESTSSNQVVTLRNNLNNINNNLLRNKSIKLSNQDIQNSIISINNKLADITQVDFSSSDGSKDFGDKLISVANMLINRMDNNDNEHVKKLKNYTKKITGKDL